MADYELKPVQFIIDNVLRAGLSAIAGGAGVGKTTALVPFFMLAAWLCSDDHPLKPELRRKVVYVTEDTEQVTRIIESVIRSSDGRLTWDEVYEWFYVVPAKRHDIKEIAAKVDFFDRLNHKNGEFTTRPVIVIDTKSAAIAFKDENSNAEASRTLAVLRDQFISRDISVVLVLHTPKTANRKDVEGMTFRGADAQGADVQQVMYLVKDDADTDLRFLAITGGTTKKRFEGEIDIAEVVFTPVKEHLVRIKAPWGKTQTLQLIHADVSVVSSAQRKERKAKNKGEAREQLQKERFEAELKLLLDFIQAHPWKYGMNDFTRNGVKVEGIRSREIPNLLNTLLEDGLIVKRELKIEGQRGQPKQVFGPFE